MSDRNHQADEHRTTARGFRAMGSSMVLTAVGLEERALDGATNVAMEFAESWERLFSRFRPDSELSRLNSEGSAVVSPAFLQVLDAAIRAHHRTGGRFNPAILPALEGLGYDRDFATLDPRKLVRAVVAPAPDAIAEIVIDRRSCRVTLPAGCQLDFGGIAKGMYVDRLAERFQAWPGGCVSAGGDLRVWGEPPDGDAWVVGVEDPANPGEEKCLISVMGVETAAVATSAMNRRVWWNGDEQVHHLIDPSTGRPVLGALRSATALAPNVETAEVATKALLVSSGRGESLHIADASMAVVIDVAGSFVVIEGRHRDACVVHPVRSPSRAA